MTRLVSLDREGGQLEVKMFKAYTIKVSALLIFNSMCILREYQNESPNVLQIISS